MEYSGGDERIAFGTMAKGQKKYGATSSRFKKNEPVIIYNVQPGDTLPGLAVKFGITTEQIRRANNLWTNDSLFLRDKLLIPVVRSANSQDGSSGSQHGECSSRTSCSDTEADLTSSMDNDGSLPPCLHRLEDETSRSGVPSTWSHPLCDSYYERDCSNWENESQSEVPFGAESLSYQGDHPLATIDPNTTKFKLISKEEGNASSNVSSPNGHVVRANSSMSNGTTSNPLSPTSQSSSSKIVDYSEKSAKDFLSRIDSAIASSRIRAKTKDLQNNTTPWVTFDSDSESDHRHSSGTSITTQSRHLRYSLRKLEKAQDELFQL
ncbi:LysM and putative peptidoglycan-binding domain-containing protein 1 [Orchesella cincta]|uniref:LysM and putative peptidoglycan-binding domain-containing protein 1 n=1 Tax=Orchesella cincta TaxID=48709 RepID=A0A1D2N626_ORCCI|nr:LysM and putative peptidoglycan-binding domain-containing protein 1 [Orchesella cincta]